MTNQVIHAQAVEALTRVIAQENGWRADDWGAIPAKYRQRYFETARLGLEAATPYMLKELRELVEDMEAQPWTEVGTVPGMAALIRSSTRGLL